MRPMHDLVCDPTWHSRSVGVSWTAHRDLRTNARAYWYSERAILIIIAQFRRGIHGTRIDELYPQILFKCGHRACARSIFYTVNFVTHSMCTIVELTLWYPKRFRLLRFFTFTSSLVSVFLLPEFKNSGMRSKFHWNKNNFWGIHSVSDYMVKWN